MKKIKIGILGSGAVGQVIASKLYNFDNDIIYFLTPNDLYYNRLKDGVVVNDKKYNIKCSKNDIMDYVILSVKNYDLDKALEDLKLYINDNTKILPLLNGIEHFDIIKNKFKNNIVYYGMIRIEASRNKDNIISSDIYELSFGYEYNNIIKEDIKILDDIFKSSNIKTNISLDMKSSIWRKWMLNMGINQISALTNSTYKDMTHKDMNNILFEIFKEVVSIAKLENINLTLEDAQNMIKESLNWTSNRYTSMAQDFINHRKSEIDTFGGMLLRLSKKHNVKCPVCEIVYSLLKAKYDNYIGE